MAHYVTCLYCKKQFNRDKEPTKKVSARRYAHLKCWEDYFANMSQEEKDIQNFYNYTKNLFGEDYNYILTKKLAEKYVKENNYTYSGMLKSLKWYYEKEGNDVKKSNGSIGILPYIYNQALNYYYLLHQAQKVNATKNAIEYVEPHIRQITIESPRVSTPKPKMWFEEDDDEI